VDSEGDSARGCPRHAVAALGGITGAHVDWTDSKGLNEWERKALELTGERSELRSGPGCQRSRAGVEGHAVDGRPGGRGLTVTAWSIAT
jgi:hypothetical protein